MKKIATIFLTFLYLVSFTGIVNGMECKIDLSSAGIHSNMGDSGCSTPGHSRQSEPHPMLEFCKVIEIHKEVLVTPNTKIIKAAFVTLPSTNYIFLSKTPLSIYPATQPPVKEAVRLFLSNRVLLI